VAGPVPLLPAARSMSPRASASDGGEQGVHRRGRTGESREFTAGDELLSRRARLAHGS
jgi:hypothetical protein